MTPSPLALLSPSELSMLRAIGMIRRGRGWTRKVKKNTGRYAKSVEQRQNVTSERIK